MARGIIRYDAEGNPVYGQLPDTKTTKPSTKTSTPRPGAIYERNLQGASPATIMKILNITDKAASAPTQDELSGLRENGQNTASIGSGKRGSQNAGVLKALKQLSAMSQQGINSSMDDLTKSLQAQTNPYANFQAQNTPTTPGLQELLKSQGVSTDPLNQFAEAINAQNTGQADAFANIAQTMGGFSDVNRTGMISDVAQQRADLLQQLQGNIFGTGSELMGKKAPDRNAISQMILAMMNKKA